MLYILAPLIVLELFLKAYALSDLLGRDAGTVKGGSKLPWVLLVLLVSTIGPLVYLFAGREEA